MIIIIIIINCSAPPVDCCAVQDKDNIPFICAAIKIKPTDPSYSEINKTCISFIRVMTASFNFNCEITPQIPVSTDLFSRKFLFM